MVKFWQFGSLHFCQSCFCLRDDSAFCRIRRSFLAVWSDCDSWIVSSCQSSPSRRRASSPGRPAPATIERRGMPISRSRALIAFRGVCCSRTPGALAYTLCICVFVYLLISILRFAILPVFLTESQRARIINLKGEVSRSFPKLPFSLLPLFRSHFARAHLAWGATGPVGQTARNRLKIGPRREGTVSNGLLESQRLTRTDGYDPASICSVARRGGISQP